MSTDPPPRTNFLSSSSKAAGTDNTLESTTKAYFDGLTPLNWDGVTLSMANTDCDAAARAV